MKRLVARPDCRPSRSAYLAYMVLMLVLMLMLGIAPIRAQDCYDYRNTFQEAVPFPLAEPVIALVADQDAAVAAAGTTLHFLDASDPDNITAIGTYDLGARPVLLDSAGKLAAVTTSTSLTLLDWSNAGVPIPIATIALPAGTVALTRTGDRLLVSRGVAGVNIYEATATGGLVLLGTADTPDEARDAALHNGWLVVADGSALLTWDITDPALPVSVHTYDSYFLAPASVEVARVESAGGHLVAATVRWQGEQFGGPTQGLDLMEMDLSGQLSLIQDAYYGGFWPEFDIVGDQLHVSHGDYSLVELGSGQEVILTLDTGLTAPQPIAAHPQSVLHATSSAALEVYDIRYPYHVAADPDWTGPAFHDIARGRVEPGFLLKQRTSWSGMVFDFASYLYDIRDPLAVVEIAHHGADGGMEEYYEQDFSDAGLERVLVSTYTSFFNSCVWHDLTTGTAIATVLPYHGDAVFDGDRICQMTGGFDPVPGIAILDASVPGTVPEIGFLPGNFSGKPVVLAESIVLLVNGDLHIYDLADPVLPVEIGSLAGAGGSLAAREGTRLYFTGSGSRFYCVDVASPAAPSLVWDVSGFDFRTLDVRGDLGLLTRSAGFDYYARVYDLASDPAGPVPISLPFAQASDTYDARWDGNFVYTGRMRVYDLSDLAAPAYLGRGAETWGSMYRDGLRIVKGNGCYPIQCTASGVLEEEPVPGVRSLFGLQAAPNPFNPQTAVNFTAPEAGEARLVLYDVTGRLVRTLLQRAIGRGAHTVQWDGRNEAGKAQASGVYFARLEMGNRAESIKLVLVR